MLSSDVVVRDVQGRRDAETVWAALQQLMQRDDDDDQLQHKGKPSDERPAPRTSNIVSAAAVLCVQPQYVVARLALSAVGVHANQASCPVAEGSAQKLTRVVSQATTAAVAEALRAQQRQQHNFAAMAPTVRRASGGHAVCIVSAAGAMAAVPVATDLLRDALLQSDSSNSTDGDGGPSGNTSSVPLKRRQPPPELGSYPLRVASASTRLGQAIKFLAMLGHPLAGFAVTAGAVPAEPALVLRVAYTPFLGFTARRQGATTPSASIDRHANRRRSEASSSEWYGNPCLAQLLTMPLAMLHDLGLPAYAASDAVLVVKHLQSSYTADAFPLTMFPSRAAQWGEFERLLEAVSGGSRDFPRPMRFLLRQLLLMVLLSEVAFEHDGGDAPGTGGGSSTKGMLCPASSMSVVMLRVVYALVTRHDAVPLDDVAATQRHNGAWDDATRMTLGEHRQRRPPSDAADDDGVVPDEAPPEDSDVVALLSAVLKTAPSPTHRHHRVVCGAVDAVFVAVMEMVVSATNQTLREIMGDDGGDHLIANHHQPRSVGNHCGRQRMNVVVTCANACCPSAILQGPQHRNTALSHQRGTFPLPRNLRQGAFSATTGINADNDVRGDGDPTAPRPCGGTIRQLLGNLSADMATALALRTVGASYDEEAGDGDEDALGDGTTARYPTEGGLQRLVLLQAVLGSSSASDNQREVGAPPPHGRGVAGKASSASSGLLTQRDDDGIIAQLLTLQAMAQRARDLPTEIRVSQQHADRHQAHSNTTRSPNGSTRIRPTDNPLPPSTPAAEADLDAALRHTRSALANAAGATDRRRLLVHLHGGALARDGSDTDSADDTNCTSSSLSGLSDPARSLPRVVFSAPHAPRRFARLRYDVSDGAPLCPSPLPPVLSPAVGGAGAPLRTRHVGDNVGDSDGHEGGGGGGGGQGAMSLLDALDVRLKRGLHRHIGVVPTEHEALRRWKEADAQCCNEFHRKLQACEWKMLEDMQALLRGVVQGEPVVHLHLSVQGREAMDSEATVSDLSAESRYAQLFWCLGGRLVGGSSSSTKPEVEHDGDGWWSCGGAQSNHPQQRFVTQIPAKTLCDTFFPLIAQAPAIAQLRADRQQQQLQQQQQQRKGRQGNTTIVSDTTFLTAVCEALEFPPHSFRIATTHDASTEQHVAVDVDNSNNNNNDTATAATSLLVVYLTALGARHIDRLHDAVDALLLQHCRQQPSTTTSDYGGGTVDADAAAMRPTRGDDVAVAAKKPKRGGSVGDIRGIGDARGGCRRASAATAADRRAHPSSTTTTPTTTRRRAAACYGGGGGSTLRLRFTPHKSFVDSGTVRSLQREGGRDADDLLGQRWHQDQAALAAAAEEDAMEAARRLEAARNDPTQPPWRREQLRPLEAAVHLTQRVRSRCGAAPTTANDTMAAVEEDAPTTQQQRPATNHPAALPPRQHGGAAASGRTPTARQRTKGHPPTSPIARAAGTQRTALASPPPSRAVVARPQGPHNYKEGSVGDGGTWGGGAVRRSAGGPPTSAPLSLAAQGSAVSRQGRSTTNARHLHMDASVSTIDAAGSNSDCTAWSLADKLNVRQYNSAKEGEAATTRSHGRRTEDESCRLPPSTAASRHHEQFNLFAFKSMVASGL